MKSKERITAVLAGRPTDKVPVMHISFASRVASDILGREAFVGGGIQRWRESVALWEGGNAHAEFLERCITDAIDIALACGHDMIRPDYWRYPRKPAARLDEYTFRYENPDGSYEVCRLDRETELYNTIEASPAPPRGFEDLEGEIEAAERAAESYSPSPDNYVEVLEVIRRRGKDYEVRVGGAWTCIAMEDPFLLEACLLRPDLIERMLDAQVVRSIKNIDFLAAHGARIFFGGGDVASDAGPMYSPRIFRDLVVPRLRTISDHCHKLNTWHLFGSDGNLWPFVDDLYGPAGVDGCYEMDRKAGMDILKLHARFPNVVMFGNLSSHKLHIGRVDDVVAETRACLDEARATGKVVVGVSNLIVPETPTRNVEAMLKTIEKYR